MKYYTWSQTALIFLKDRIIFLKMLYGSKKIRISISLLNLLQVQICPSFDCFHSIFMQNVSPRIIHRARPTMRVLIRHPIFLQPNFAGRIGNGAQLRIFPEMRLGFQRLRHLKMTSKNSNLRVFGSYCRGFSTRLKIIRP